MYKAILVELLSFYWIWWKNGYISCLHWLLEVRNIVICSIL